MSSSTSSEAPRDDTALGRAIAKVADPDLRTVLEREVGRLKDSRRFGLVFDRHLPESARLPTHPVRVGVTVVRRDDLADEVRTVVALDGDTATLDDGSSSPLTRLVVFRDFGDVVHPSLTSVERLDRGSAEDPWHVVVKGENLHALQVLRQTHRGLVDLIYIDPPYNTGNDGWIYDDRYVDANDRARSSKWLSFMERRLTIARSLLKPTGVIIVAIGDDEHHRLRMLMDQVFGASNFIANVVWQGGRKNDSRYVSASIDYMVMHARDGNELDAAGSRWRDQKPGVNRILDAAAAIWARSDGNDSRATTEFKRWWRSLDSNDEARGSKHYDRIDARGRVYFAAPLISPSPRPNLMYQVERPGGGDPYLPPGNGWRVSQATMQALQADDELYYGPTGIYRKTFLSNVSSQVPDPVLQKDRKSAGGRLASLLGQSRFPYPKDHEVLMRWIRLAAPDDAVVLDFFGGSGSTTEAVMRLNAEDGGTRQSILVTNNEVGAKRAKQLRKDGHSPGDPEWEEVGVFDYVTRPRIATVVTGTRPDGTTYSEGLEANVELFELGYLDPADIRLGHEFAAIAPILWLEAGATGERIDADPGPGWALADTYGVLFDADALKPFAEAVMARGQADDLPSLIFVITDSPTELRIVAERLPAGCAVRRLYESHIDRFALAVDGEAP